MPLHLGDIHLDKDVPVPLYYQLAQYLLERIRTGGLAQRECLPTEMDFVKMLGISRSTVRQALDDLVNAGYLTREKGRGTFVCRPKIDEGFFQKLDSFNQEMRQKGFEPGTRVLSAGRVSGRPDINRQLGLADDQPLFQLSRLRLADGEPVVFLETWLPDARLPGLAEMDFTTQSLYGILEARYGCRVERAVRKIEAVAAKPQEARLLSIKTGEPICLVRSVARLGDDTPIEYSVARYRGDRNQFTVELVRRGG
jgi:GntR family transcriptional regulator